MGIRENSRAGRTCVYYNNKQYHIAKSKKNKISSILFVSRLRKYKQKCLH